MAQDTEQIPQITVPAGGMSSTDYTRGLSLWANQIAQQQQQMPTLQDVIQGGSRSQLPGASVPYISTPTPTPRMPQLFQAPMQPGTVMPKGQSLYDKKMAKYREYGNTLGNMVSLVANQELKKQYEAKKQVITDVVNAKNGIDESNRIKPYIDAMPDSPTKQAALKEIQDNIDKNNSIIDRIRGDPAKPSKEWKWVQESMPDYVNPKNNDPQKVGPHNEAVAAAADADIAGRNNPDRASANVSNKSDIVQGKPPADPTGVQQLSTEEAAAVNKQRAAQGQPPLPASAVSATPAPNAQAAQQGRFGVTGQMQQPMAPGAFRGPAGAAQPVQAGPGTQGNQPGAVPQLFRRPAPGQAADITTPASRMTPAAQREAGIGQHAAEQLTFPQQMGVNPAAANQIAFEQKMSEAWVKSIMPAQIREHGEDVRKFAEEQGKKYEQDQKNIMEVTKANLQVQKELLQDARQYRKQEFELWLKEGAIGGGKYGTATINAADKQIKDYNAIISEAEKTITAREAAASAAQQEITRIRARHSFEGGFLGMGGLSDAEKQEIAQQQAIIDGAQATVKVKRQQIDEMGKNRDNAIKMFQSAGIGGASSAGVSGLGAGMGFPTTGGPAGTPAAAPSAPPTGALAKDASPIPISQNKAGYIPQRILDPMIDQAAAGAGVPRNMVAAVLQIESGGDPIARSSTDAGGLMQMTRGTAAKYGVRDPYNPPQAIAGAAKYLRDLLNAPWANGDPSKAAAGYTVGPALMEAAGGDINKLPTSFTYPGGYTTNPRKNAQDYVAKFQKLVGGGGGTSGGTTTDSAKQQPAVRPSGGTLTPGVEAATRGKPSAAHPLAAAGAPPSTATGTAAPQRPEDAVPTNEIDVINKLANQMGISGSQ